MSVNKDQPHVFVLPEDDANRELANGFHLGLDQSVQRKMHVLGVAGGWNKVMARFKSDHAAAMDRYFQRFMVLLIDFDHDAERLMDARSRIPGHLRERVFILGVWSEPEELRTRSGRSYEKLGLEMAHDCRDGTDQIWAHDLLRHNAGELDRLRENVRPILFFAPASALPGPLLDT